VRGLGLRVVGLGFRGRLLDRWEEEEAAAEEEEAKGGGHG